ARISFGIIALDVLCRFGVTVIHRPWFATDAFIGLATFARADALVIGALLAQRERSTGWGREKRWAVPVALASAAVIVVIRALEKASMFPILTYNLKWPVIGIGVGAGLLYVLIWPPRWLEWRWLAWIGQISYGIYVIHSCFGYFLHGNFKSAPVWFVL